MSIAEAHIPNIITGEQTNRIIIQVPNQVFENIDGSIAIDGNTALLNKVFEVHHLVNDFDATLAGEFLMDMLVWFIQEQNIENKEEEISKIKKIVQDGINSDKGFRESSFEPRIHKLIQLGFTHSDFIEYVKIEEKNISPDFKNNFKIIKEYGKFHSTLSAGILNAIQHLYSKCDLSIDNFNHVGATTLKFENGKLTGYNLQTGVFKKSEYAKEHILADKTALERTVVVLGDGIRAKGGSDHDVAIALIALPVATKEYVNETNDYEEFMPKAQIVENYGEYLKNVISMRYRILDLLNKGYDVEIEYVENKGIKLIKDNSTKNIIILGEKIPNTDIAEFSNIHFENANKLNKVVFPKFLIN